MTRTYDVGDLCDDVAAVVGERFPDEVWVRGVISSLSRPGTGHVYFDLVDPDRPDRLVPVVLFDTARQRVNTILRKSGAVRMADGLEIRIRGQVGYFARTSRVQLRMSLIDPAHTVGRLELARLALLRELTDAGLVDRNGRLPFPVAPRRIALVTSDGSAAEADTRRELEASRFRWDLRLYDSRVQGSAAAAELAAAIAAAAAWAEVVVVVRGGGARSDLAVFDDRAVAEAIAGAAVPVVVGVGHETDRSVADDVAARSVKTPTAAARALIDRLEAYERRVEACGDRLAQAGRRALDTAAVRLEQFEGRLDGAARAALGGEAGRLDRLDADLRRTASTPIERDRARLDLAAARLDGHDPRRLLDLGWSLTRRSDGTVVRGPDDVAAGDRLRTETAGGVIVSTVEDPGLAPETDHD